MPRLTHLLIAIFVMIGLAACDNPSNDAENTGTNTAAFKAAKFDREFRKKGCELLTSELVAEVFGVPAGELKQMKIMGCRYNWSDDTETLETGISMIQSHDSEEKAVRWFTNATKSKTAEEMAAEMEAVSRRLDKQEQLKTNDQKAMAQSILKSVGTKAVNFEDVISVGDQARANDGGNIYVRVSNLTFIVSAYKGAKAPPPSLKGVELKEMVKIAKSASVQWAIKTAPQRKVDGAKLARAIVAGL